MLKVYGSKFCPDCIACKKALTEANAEFEFVDIHESLPNLKAFLALRDREAVFAPCKEIGRIGIPALIPDDGAITLDWEGQLEKMGIQPHPPVQEGAACSLDGHGC